MTNLTSIGSSPLSLQKHRSMPPRRLFRLQFLPAVALIASIIEDYSHVRLHSALSFLRPVDYYRGNPEALLAERRRRLKTARGLRNQ